MNGTVAPPTVCPRCGARLRPEQATWQAGAPGYLPTMRWTHRRPDDGRPCHLNTGPPVGYSLSPGPNRPGGTIPA